MGPGLDGYQGMELAREEIEPDTHLPILVRTAGPRNAARPCALLLGARDSMTKPLDPVEALLRIRLLLETRSFFRSLSAGRGSP